MRQRKGGALFYAGQSIRTFWIRWYLGKDLKALRRQAMVLSQAEKQHVQRAPRRDPGNCWGSARTPLWSLMCKTDSSRRWGQRQQGQHWPLKGLNFIHQVEKTLQGSGQRTDRTWYMFRKHHSRCLQKRWEGTGWDGNGLQQRMKRDRILVICLKSPECADSLRGLGEGNQGWLRGCKLELL